MYQTESSFKYIEMMKKQVSAMCYRQNQLQNSTKPGISTFCTSHFNLGSLSHNYKNLLVW